MTPFGHKFEYQHDKDHVRVTFEAPSDVKFVDLLDMFRRYAVACGFSKQTVEEYLGGGDD